MDGIITEKDYPIQGLWILKSIRYSLTYFVIIIISLYWSSGEDPESPLHFWIYIVLAVVPFGLILAILNRATFHYSIEPKFLTLRQGIFSRQQRHIPYGVIQNLFVKQDLSDRILGLSSLMVENASSGAFVFVDPKEREMEEVGFYGNRVSIPGLTKANAEILKGIVLQKMKENPIEDSQSGL